MPTAELSVALYADGGMYKHWALFINGPTASDRFILNARGSSTRYRFETEQTDAREAPDLHEMLPLCVVDVSKIPAIRAAGERAVIHNEAPGYNCQDYVLELLGTLEAEGVLDGGDRVYRRNKRVVEGRQDGLE